MGDGFIVVVSEFYFSVVVVSLFDKEWYVLYELFMWFFCGIRF